MPVTTIYRIAEQTISLIEGGGLATASSITMNEIKIAIGQSINALLKVEHFTINEKMNEKIPNGSVVALYENIPVINYNGSCKAVLPIKPIKLPRNIGIFGIYPKYTLNGNYEFNKEWIPLQMGQSGLIQSQLLLNGLLGQVGYDNFGMDIYPTKNVKSFFPDIVLAMRLVIMDISQYGDYDPLPILPEMEMQVIQEVFKLYISQPVPDKVVDGTVKENKSIPLKQQQQT